MTQKRAASIIFLAEFRSEYPVTQSPTPPPNDPRRSDEGRSRPAATGPLRPLEFDEMVALFVAFLSLGGVLFWGLSRGDMSLLSGGGLTTGPVAVAPRADDESPLGSNGITDAGAASEAESSGDTAAADDTEAATIAGNGSAVSELSAQAAARRERLATRKPIWEDVRDGMAGAAAGVTGAAITADAADADAADTDVEEPIAAASDTAESSEAAEEGEVPDIAAAIPSKAATDAPKEALAFNDVADDYWAKPYIDALSSRGLITGFEDGSFKPDAEITRAQTANIVSRTFDLTADKENLEFSDVSSDYWARESIGEVVRGGFMTGFPDDTFDPGAAVTRAQALTTLVTGLGIESPTNIQASLDRYTDANEIPNWANEKMAAATTGSLVVNHPEITQLNPTGATTRAELSAMIYQALVREGVVDPIESTYVVKP